MSKSHDDYALLVAEEVLSSTDAQIEEIAAREPRRIRLWAKAMAKWIGDQRHDGPDGERVTLGETWRRLWP